MGHLAIERDCGIDFDRLDAWRQTESLLACTVTLTPMEPRELGRFELPRTMLRIEGPEDQVRALYHRFELQFLSAGG